MGQFSWITSDTKKCLSDVCTEKDAISTPSGYLLNPLRGPFEKNYFEKFYDGYGEFAGQDVYALVVKWNAPFLCKDINDNDIPDGRLRNIGIDIACYDEDNAFLPFPIKVTEEDVPYETAAPSSGDPYQGWMSEDSDDYYESDVENEYSLIQDDIKDFAAKSLVKREYYANVLYPKLCDLLYNIYKVDWTSETKGDKRIIDNYIADFSNSKSFEFSINEEIGINNGQCYACYDEFMDNDFIYIVRDIQRILNIYYYIFEEVFSSEKDNSSNIKTLIYHILIARYHSNNCEL